MKMHGILNLTCPECGENTFIVSRPTNLVTYTIACHCCGTVVATIPEFYIESLGSNEEDEEDKEETPDADAAQRS